MTTSAQGQVKECHPSPLRGGKKNQQKTATLKDVTVFIYLLISGLTCLPKSTAIIIFAQSSAM